ncbi:unnamed protein product [Symbiodinium natans]|uniref:Uncharacterized protein n=1 Tax=Symbiodinium natans TaxID=878477 RepID=A0A812IA38_9DINO|nr:unnamed protein product [Symbiodinium natans]
MSDSDTKCSSESAGEDSSDKALWATLPAPFRSAYGGSAGDLPPCEVLAYLFDDDTDLSQMLDGFMVDQRSKTACVSALCVLRDRALPQAQRLEKRCAIIPAERQLLELLRKKPRVGPPKLPAPTRQWLQKQSGAVRRACAWPSRRAKQLAGAKSNLQRCDVEQQELLRWRGELVTLIQAAKLPVCDQANLSKDPEATISAAVGAARASTIRSRVREWRRARAYFLAVSSSPWPKHVGLVLDYLHEQRLEPCARSVPTAILKCLAFMEKAGGVPEQARFSTHTVVRNTVNQFVMELESGAPPKRKAPLLLVAMIASLELAVLDDALPLYTRGFAFYKLLKLWTACRSGDLTGLSPSSLVLSSDGLQGVLERTKTTGPGKRVRYLPIFVSRRAFLVSPDWLTVGFAIWQADSMAFARDYYLPLPTADFAGARKVMAEYPQVVAMTKALWRSLRLPCWQDGKWSLSEALLFETLEPLRFWSEHSERNWLVSLLSMLDVPRDQRDFVGRWSVASASDEYVRTARQLVMRLQARAASALKQPDEKELRCTGINELSAFLSEQGFEQAELVELRERLHLDLSRLPDVDPVLGELNAAAMPPVSALGESAGAERAVESGEDPAPAYFIAVVGKRRLRRLHRQGGCGTVPADLLEMLPLQSLKNAVYDLACKHCWPRGAKPGDSSSDTGSGDDSSSSSSASSDAA